MSRKTGTVNTEVIDKAVKIFGSKSALARKLGITRQHLNYWYTFASLPYEAAIAICIATEHQVTIDELRPDLKKLTRFFAIT